MGIKDETISPFNSSYLPKLVAKNLKRSALFERNEAAEGWGLRSRQKMLTCFTQNYKAPDERSHKCQECHYCAQTAGSKILVNTHTVQMGLHTQTNTKGWRGHVHKLQYMLERSERENINCVWLNSDSRCADTLLLLSSANRRYNCCAVMSFLLPKGSWDRPSITPGMEKGGRWWQDGWTASGHSLRSPFLTLAT